MRIKRLWDLHVTQREHVIVDKCRVCPWGPGTSLALGPLFTAS